MPIGLVNTTWGGTQIESWMSEPALRSNPAFAVVFGRWQQRLAEYPGLVAAYPAAVRQWLEEGAQVRMAGKAYAVPMPLPPEGPESRWEPAGLYNAMVAPLVPTAIRGFLWYQGETNAGRASEYGALFTTLIRQWRTDFAQGDLPFYFVQLPGYEDGNAAGQQWAFLREAQAGALALPATGMAVTIDLGDPKNIHPKNKQEVGRRLALVARAQLLGEKIETEGPVFAHAMRDENSLLVSFTHADGLKLVPSSQGLAGFEVAGTDQRFFPARAHLDGQTLLVSAAGVPKPVAVRYAWSNSPDAELFNNAGLPARPFRSDNW